MVSLDDEGSLLTESELIVDNLGVPGVCPQEGEVYISDIAILNFQHFKLRLHIEKTLRQPLQIDPAELNLPQ